MNSEPKMILFVGTPRSGSNHFLTFINNQKNGISLYELFHDCLSTRKYLDTMLKNVKFYTEYKLNKIDYLKKVKKEVKNLNYSFFTFKVFKGHIGEQELKKIIKEFKPYVVFLSRNKLQVHISLAKALHYEKWIRYSTTDLKVELNKNLFFEDAIKTESWMQSIHKYLINENIPHSTLEYENFEGQHNLSKLHEFLRKIFLSQGVDYEKINIKHMEILKKQDNTKNPFDKIINKLEIKEFIKTKSKEGYDLISNYLKTKEVIEAPCSCFN